MLFLSTTCINKQNSMVKRIAKLTMKDISIFNLNSFKKQFTQQFYFDFL